MNPFEDLAARIRTGRPVPWPIAGLLTAATPVTRLGMWSRLRRTPVSVDATVISFGNITAGGTGKTPCVIERAQCELDNGRTVGVLTRGYHSPEREPAVSADMAPADYYRKLGDEAALILRHAPGAIVFKNPNRVAAAQLAVERYGCDVLILDDGFQFVRLARNENVLVVDSSNPFGNHRLLPRGILREPLPAMARATSVVLTRCDQAKSLDDLETIIRNHCGDIPIRRTVHRPSGVWRVSNGELTDLDWLKGREIAAACSIGNPESFFDALRMLGAHVVEATAHPDHAPLPHDAVAGTRPVVVTEKDAVRIERPSDNVFALSVEVADC